MKVGRLRNKSYVKILSIFEFIFIISLILYFTLFDDLQGVYLLIFFPLALVPSIFYFFWIKKNLEFNKKIKASIMFNLFSLIGMIFGTYFHIKYFGQDTWTYMGAFFFIIVPSLILFAISFVFLIPDIARVIYNHYHKS